jgi:phage tail-like protein
MVNSNSKSSDYSSKSSDYSNSSSKSSDYSKSNSTSSKSSDRQSKYNQLNFVTTNRFYVEIAGEIAASFTECGGLGVQIKKNVFHEGGVNDQQRIYLGQADFTDVTLKRGLTNHPGFWDWLNKVFDEKKPTNEQKEELTVRKNVNILLFDRSGETMMSWTLIGAIPVGWKTPAFQADGNAVAIEELTIAYEGLKVGKDKGGGVPVIRLKDNGSFPSN